MLIKRIIESGANDLTTVFRPYKIDEFVGNDFSKKLIKAGLDKHTLSHSLLFTGPTGCGKTTAARIIALGLNCETTTSSTSDPCLVCDSCKSIMQQCNLDVVEINVGESGGKDAVDQITKNLNYSPFTCKYKVLIFDEAHKLTHPAQDLLLKKIEDGYSYVYFIFCTNQPEKLVDAFRSRTYIGALHFSALSTKLTEELLVNVCDYEGIRYKKSVISAITEYAKGSPRHALGILKQVIDEGSWDDNSIKVLVKDTTDSDDPDVWELCKSLLMGNFTQAVNTFSKIKNIQEELLRCTITGFFVGRLKKVSSIDEGIKLTRIIDILLPSIYTSGVIAKHDFINRFFKVTTIINGR